MWRHKKIRPNDAKVTLTKSQKSMAAEYSSIEPKDSAEYFKKMQEKSRTVENECKWWCCWPTKIVLIPHHDVVNDVLKTLFLQRN